MQRGASGGPPIAAVTGANGYLGSWVVQRALEHGLSVRACVRDATSARYAWLLADRGSAALHAGQQFTLHSANLEQRGSYDAAFSGASIVFHVAASLHRGGAFSSAEDAQQEQQQQQLHAAMRLATLRIIESIQHAPSVACVVYTSSIATMMDLEPSAYRVVSPHLPSQPGAAVERTPLPIQSVSMQRAPMVINEERRPNRTRLGEPHHHAWYSLGKLDSEDLLTAAAAASQGRWIVLHAAPSDILGPLRHRSHADGSWPARVAAALRRETVRPAVSNRPWILVDVRDAAEAQVRLALLLLQQQQQDHHHQHHHQAVTMRAASSITTRSKTVETVEPPVHSGSRVLLSAHPDCYTDSADVARAVVAITSARWPDASHVAPHAPTQHRHAPEWDGLVADNAKAVRLLGHIFRPLNETLRATVDSLVDPALGGMHADGSAGGHEMGNVGGGDGAAMEGVGGGRPRGHHSGKVEESGDDNDGPISALAQWHALLHDVRSELGAAAALKPHEPPVRTSRTGGSKAERRSSAASTYFTTTSYVASLTGADSSSSSAVVRPLERDSAGAASNVHTAGAASKFHTAVAATNAAAPTHRYAAGALATCGVMAMPLALGLARLVRAARRSRHVNAMLSCVGWLVVQGGAHSISSSPSSRPLRAGSDGSGRAAAAAAAAQHVEPWRLHSIGLLMAAFLALNASLSLLNRWAQGDAPGLAGLCIPLSTTSAHMCVSAALLMPSMASDRPGGYTDATHATALGRHRLPLALAAALNCFQVATNLASLGSLGLASNQAIRALGPVLMGFSAWAETGRAPPPCELLLLTSVTAGAVLVAFGGGGPSHQRRWHGYSSGVALAFFSTVAQCAQVTVSSRLMRGRSRLDCWQLTLYSGAIGFALVLPCAWLLEAAALEGALRAQPHTTLAYLVGSALLALLYHSTIFQSLHVLSASGTVVLGQVKTVVLLLLAAILLGELGELSATQVAGASLAVGAAGAYSYTQARLKDKAEV